MCFCYTYSKPGLLNKKDLKSKRDENLLLNINEKSKHLFNNFLIHFFFPDSPGDFAYDVFLILRRAIGVRLCKTQIIRFYEVSPDV